MALEILAGKRADSIPVLMESPTEDIFDFKVMKRFKLSPDSLPDGSVVINRPYSFYAEYKALVWSTSMVFSTLVALVIALSLNVRRRLQVERELQGHREHLENVVTARTADLTESNKALIDSEERFRSLSGAAFEGIVFSENGVVIEVNNAICEILEYAQDELIGKEISVFVPPQERANVKEKMQSGYEGSYESRCLKKDGAVLPIKAQAKMFVYKGRKVRVTAISDLSEQKKAEEEIKTLRGILPICAKCKMTRDDHGYWNQIEAYIEAHSDAEFSHGIRKECARELYPHVDLEGP